MAQPTSVLERGRQPYRAHEPSAIHRAFSKMIPYKAAHGTRRLKSSFQDRQLKDVSPVSTFVLGSKDGRPWNVPKGKV